MKYFVLILLLILLLGCKRHIDFGEAVPGTANNGWNNPMMTKNSDEIDLFNQDKPGVIEKKLIAMIDEDKEGFVITHADRASWSKKNIPIAGRLQVYVRRGSQYGTWSQFPDSVRYEVVVEQGKIAVTRDYSMSISEENATYEYYGKMPADQIVGSNFEINIFSQLSEIIDGAGQYKIRARYYGRESNWLELTVDP